LNQIITFFPYLAAGYYVNNFKEALSGAGKMFDRTLPIMFGFLLFPALYALKYIPDFYGFISISPVFSLLYRGMLVVAGTLLAVLFIKQISGKYTYPVKMLFVLCGILSLEIYLTHLIVLHYLGFYQVTLWPDTGLVGVGIGTLAVLLAAIAASLALSYNKWISRFFFGRWVQKTIKDLARSRISPDSVPADQP
jgi:peptidoglycan/LPS O-acetylase OafA/YrhL